jgi:hypothetical protein
LAKNIWSSEILWPSAFPAITVFYILK